MDVEIVRKHWQLIELAAKHDYIPNGQNGAIVELKNNYNGTVDLWCGFCVVNMCKRIYNEYKDKV